MFQDLFQGTLTKSASAHMHDGSYHRAVASKNARRGSLQAGSNATDWPPPWRGRGAPAGPDTQTSTRRARYGSGCGHDFTQLGELGWRRQSWGRFHSE